MQAVSNIVQTIKPVLYVLVAVAAIAVAYLRTGEYFILRSSQIRNEAIDGCQLNTRYSFQESESTTVVVPVEAKYQDCLKLKNISK